MLSGQMRQLLFLDIDEVVFEYGVQLMNGLIQLVYEHNGIELWSSCFGVAFHMIRRGLVIFGKEKQLKKRRQLNVFSTLLMQSWNQ